MKCLTLSVNQYGKPNGKYSLKFVFDVAVGICGAELIYFYIFFVFFCGKKFPSFHTTFVRSFIRSFDGWIFHDLMIYWWRVRRSTHGARENRFKIIKCLFVSLSEPINSTQGFVLCAQRHRWRCCHLRRWQSILDVIEIVWKTFFRQFIINSNRLHKIMSRGGKYLCLQL